MEPDSALGLARMMHDSAQAMGSVRHMAAALNLQAIIHAMGGDHAAAIGPYEEPLRSRVGYFGGMNTEPFGHTLARIFAELSTGIPGAGGFVLNQGDEGLLAALDKLGPAEASRNTQGGATIAAHAEHLRYGLSLMNAWAAQGGNPFAHARWYQAWRITTVDAGQWLAIRSGLRHEIDYWRTALGTPRTVNDLELGGMIGSVAHLAYHLGAIRQIHADARGPKDPTTDH